ncbi:MAG TPA: hypothetical protein VMB03_12545 [Bryobacteraceae bacterium]|nr:hypothetical protein [Bryobacteraceae bacterium]
MIKRIYRLLLSLYPYDYRAMFAQEMLRTFDQLTPDRHTRELASLLIGTAREWIAKRTTDPVVRGRALPDVRMIRPVGVTRELWFGSN